MTTYTAIHGYTGETVTFYNHSEALNFINTEIRGYTGRGIVTMFENGCQIAQW